MASVDGARSLKGASEETFEHVCEPCNYREIQKEAQHFCNYCQEMLCQGCTDSHRGQKISRNHKILFVGELYKRALPQRASCCGVLCECNQKSEIAVYCRDHDDVMCHGCSVLKHRTCKTDSIGDASTSYSQERLSSIDQRACRVKIEIEKTQDKRKRDLNIFNSQAEKAKKDLKTFREVTNRKLDLMEQTVLNEIDQRVGKKQQEVDYYISSCSATTQMIKIDLKLLNDVMKTALKTDMFAAGVKISKRLGEYENLLRDICHETKPQSLTFKRNEELNSMLSKLNNIGTVCDVVSSQSGVAMKTLFPGLKVERTSRVNIKLPYDKKSPAITGCVFMSDGRAVLCDNNNNRLKLFSDSFKLLGSLDFPTNPWDISMIDDSTAIITLPNKKQLQYIELVTRLKPGRVLQLDKPCYGVEIVGADIYVTCYSAFTRGKGAVMIVDRDGNVRKTLGVDQNGTFMFTCPLYLTVNAKSSRIYVSAFLEGTVTCLTSDGTVIYQYRDHDLSGPSGVCIDDEDNTIICGRDSNNLHVVTAAGKKHKLLLTSEEGINNPLAVAYRQTDGTLIIGCRGDENMLVCRLGYD